MPKNTEELGATINLMLQMQGEGSSVQHALFTTLLQRESCRMACLISGGGREAAGGPVT